MEGRIVRESPLRAKHAREYLEVGYKSWKKKYEYGKRSAVEGVFSLVRRIIGESVSAAKTEQMFHEVGLKFKFAKILINALSERINKKIIKRFY